MADEPRGLFAPGPLDTSSASNSRSPPVILHGLHSESASSLSVASPHVCSPSASSARLMTPSEGRSRGQSVSSTASNQKSATDHPNFSLPGATLSDGSRRSSAQQATTELLPEAAVSNSSLSGPSVPSSPRARESFKRNSSSSGGGSHSSSGIRSTLSRQAKSFRHSFLWTGSSNSGLDVSAPGSTTHSLTPSPLSSFAPSPLVSEGHFLAPASRSLAPHSPTASDFSHSVVSSSEDVRLKRESESQPEPVRPPRSHSPFMFRKASKHNLMSLTQLSESSSKPSSSSNKKKNSDRAATSLGFNNPHATKSQASNISSIEEKDPATRSSNHSRTRSRFSLQDQSWTKTLTSMASKNSKKKVTSSKVTQTHDASSSRSKDAGSTEAAFSRLRNRSMDSPQLSNRRESLPKRPPSLLLHPRAEDRDTAPSPEPKISPSVAATIAFMNSDFMRSEEEVELVPELKAVKRKSLVESAADSVIVKPVGGPNVGPEGPYRFPTSPDAQTDKNPGEVISVLTVTDPSRSSTGYLAAEPQPVEVVMRKDDLKRISDVAQSPEAAKVVVAGRQSADLTAPGRSGHRKQKSVGSVSQITASALEAAENLGSRTRGGLYSSTGMLQSRPSAGLMSHSSSMVTAPDSLSGAQSPGDESTVFFDAMTSPTSEFPPVLHSQAESLASFASVASLKANEGSSSAGASQATSFGSNEVVLPAVVTTGSRTHSRQGSISRTLSVVLDPRQIRSRANSIKDSRAAPATSPDPEEQDRALPPRPETSLGFSLRNALRRERKSSSGNLATMARSMAMTPANQKTTSAQSSARGSAVSPPAAATNKAMKQKKTTLSSSTPSSPAVPRLGGKGIIKRTPGGARSVSDNAGSSTASTTSSAASSRVSSVTLATTPTKSRTASSPVTSASARSTPSSRVHSPPSSYRAPMKRGAPSSSPSETTTIVANSGPRSLPSVFVGSATPTSTHGSAHRLHAHSSAKVSDLISNSPPTMNRYLGLGEAGTGLSSRVAASSSSLRPGLGRSTAAGSDKLTPSDKSIATMSSGSTITSRTSVNRSKDSSSDSPTKRMTASKNATSSKANGRNSLSKASRERREALSGDPFPRPATSMNLSRSPINRRKLSQPTLDMTDDKEFLAALEQVRALHRERIAAEAAEADKKARLARLGMMSAHHLKTPKAEQIAEGSLERGRTTVRRPDKSSSPKFDAPERKRSASAEGRLDQSSFSRKSQEDSEGGASQSVDDVQKSIIRANAQRKPVLSLATSGLEWGVGKASGKLRDGAFVNDDDWKKEVKALFLIRELVQTERSYARHLSSLLAVVRSVNPLTAVSSATVKRKSSGNLFSTSSLSPNGGSKQLVGPLPPHLASLRTFLPQLIALSRALAHRVEENPTSAGVGAAFETLGAQLEATFVNWSAVVWDVMANLRTTEASKSKLKLGLVPLLPPDLTEVGARPRAAFSPEVSPTKPRSRSTLDLLGQNNSPMSSKDSSPMSDTAAPPPLPPKDRTFSDSRASPREESVVMGAASRSHKRRSTVTSVNFTPPTSLLGSTMRSGHRTRPSSPTTESGLPARPSSPWGQLASLTLPRSSHNRSSSGLITPLPTPTTAKAGSAAAPLGVAKLLSPMDIVIMPTQRIPRYALMLRDLLSNTPPQSLSHARVERALEAVQKVALLCDSASTSA